MLAEQPTGVRADEVAHALGKSTSTAYYLLTSLCEEGFAVHESKGLYRPAHGLEQLTAAAEQAAPIHDDLKGTVDKLFVRTRTPFVSRRRSAQDGSRSSRSAGVRGCRRCRGLGSEIRDSAHALAMGKVVLVAARRPDRRRATSRGACGRSRRTRSPRPTCSSRSSSACGATATRVDREEFDENFCCIAAPIFDALRARSSRRSACRRRRHVFDTEREQLAATVMDVARAATDAAGRTTLQADAENRQFLPPEPDRTYVVRGGTSRTALQACRDGGKSPAKRSRG